MLEQLIPGLEVKGITVSVREISQKSPLREAFAFGLVANILMTMEQSQNAIVVLQAAAKVAG